MGVRYRKSIKIVKGARVNVSKSGLSLSLGGAGHSVNYSSKGKKVTVGIPGSGISYSTYQKKPDGKENAVDRETRGVQSSALSIGMNDKGQISVFDSSGKQITDQTLLRKIKASTQFQAEKERLDNIRKQKIEQLLEESQNENEIFYNIHTLSPFVYDRDSLARVIETMEPQKYEVEPFTKKEPSEQDILEMLQNEALEVVKGNFLVINRKRKQYVQDNQLTRLREEKAKWFSEKAAFEKEQEEIAKRQNEIFLREFEDAKKAISGLMEGKEELIDQVITEWISNCSLPVEINIEYDWNREKKEIYLDVDLPEIEDLPQTEYVKLVSGNIKEKKKRSLN